MIATPTAPDTEHGSTTASVSVLLSGILDDAQTLVRQQAAMLRAEIREDARRTVEVILYLSVGGVLAAVGVLFTMVSLVYLLHWFVPALPLWACWAIFGGIDIVGGAIAIIIGRKLLGSYNPLPDKTLHAIEENLTWKTTSPRN